MTITAHLNTLLGIMIVIILDRCVQCFLRWLGVLSVKCFKDGNKNMSFEVVDEKLLKRYIKIRKKISSLINKESDSKPVHGNSDKYIKTRIKLYGDKKQSG